MPDKEKIYVLAYASKHYPETFSQEYERPGGGRQVLSREYDPVFIKVEPGEWEKALSQIPEGSNVMFMDHSGHKLFGIDKNEFIDQVASKKPKVCYAGSCYSSEYKDKFLKKSPKTRYVGDTDSWLGFDISKKGDTAIINPGDIKRLMLSDGFDLTSDDINHLDDTYMGRTLGVYPQEAQDLIATVFGRDILREVAEGERTGNMGMLREYLANDVFFGGDEAEELADRVIENHRRYLDYLRSPRRVVDNDSVSYPIPNRMQPGGTVAGGELPEIEVSPYRKLTPDQARQWWAELDQYAQEYGQDAFKEHYPEVFNWYYNNAPQLSNKTLVDSQSNETGKVMGAAAQLVNEIESIPQAIMTSAVTGEWGAGKIFGSMVDGKQHYPSDYIDNETVGLFADVLADPAIIAGAGKGIVNLGKALLKGGVKLNANMMKRIGKINAKMERIRKSAEWDKATPEQREIMIQDMAQDIKKLSNDVMDTPEYKKRSKEMGLPVGEKYNKGFDLKDDSELPKESILGHSSYHAPAKMDPRDVHNMLIDIKNDITKMGADAYKAENPKKYQWYQKYKGTENQNAWYSWNDKFSNMSVDELSEYYAASDVNKQRVDFWRRYENAYKDADRIDYWTPESFSPDRNIAFNRDIATYELNYEEMEGAIAHELGHDQDAGIYAWATKNESGAPMRTRKAIEKNDDRYSVIDLPEKYTKGLADKDEVYRQADEAEWFKDVYENRAYLRDELEINQRLKQLRMYFNPTKESWYDPISAKKMLNTKNEAVQRVIKETQRIMQRSMTDGIAEKVTPKQAAEWLSEQLNNWRVVAPLIPAGATLSQLKNNQSSRAQYGGRVLPTIKTVFES